MPKHEAGWRAPRLSVGDLEPDGPKAVTFTGTAAGWSWRMKKGQEIFLQAPLDYPDFPYDGSGQSPPYVPADLRLVILWSLKSAGGAGESVGWELDHGLVPLGGNPRGTLDGTIGEVVNVDGQGPDELLETILGAIPGKAGAKSLGLALRYTNGSSYGDRIFLWGARLEKAA